MPGLFISSEVILRWPKKLTKNGDLKAIGMWTDNWFTSYELAEELTNKKLTLVATISKTKIELPPSMLTAAPMWI